MVVERLGPDGCWSVVMWSDVAPVPCRSDEFREDPYDEDFNPRPHGGWLAFKGRNYALFSVLADVQNWGGEGHIRPLDSEHRGLPPGSSAASVECGFDSAQAWYYSVTWCLLSELLAYDWGALVERGNSFMGVYSVGELCGQDWSDFVCILTTLGPPEGIRLVYGFDS